VCEQMIRDEAETIKSSGTRKESGTRRAAKTVTEIVSGDGMIRICMKHIRIKCVRCPKRRTRIYGED